MRASLTPGDMSQLDLDRGHKAPEGTDIRDHMARQEREVRKKESHTSLYSTDITGFALGNVLFPGGVHLPDGVEIGTLYIENGASAATTILRVSIGAGGGPVLGRVKGQTYQRISVPDFITSLTISVDALVAPDTGLIICQPTSLKWSPTRGTM